MAVDNKKQNQDIRLLPSFSYGIYKIIPYETVTRICVVNSSGIIIYESSKSISEINIAKFPAGIYFYAITDEKENVFRGRIVKE